MYHEGNRQLQDAFDSRRISDRLEEKLTRTAFTADDKAFIESAIYFFLATADAEGRPDCSFKGGAPGFVRVTGAGRAGLPRLRRQRHVQEPGQHRWSIPTSACCSSTCTRSRGACASTARRTRRRDDPLLAQHGRRAADRARDRRAPSSPTARATSRSCSWSSRRSTRRSRAASPSSRPGRALPTSRTTCIRASPRSAGRVGAIRMFVAIVSDPEGRHLS